MQGDRDHAEMMNDATNRPLEALGRIRRPYPNQGRSGPPQARAAEEIKVSISEGAKHQNLYSHYAQGVEASSPVNKTLEIARNAARDGQPMETIVQILSHDPKAQQFGDKSEQFIKTVSQAAVRKTQAESSSEQLRRQSQKTPALER
ncbi:hypothetical protein AVDCRST_MAG94-1609 [uncultured Leptolyngbya sp.]|uniref:Uncharacterized protein n=1 Tax=uncultured Leptolyngbya sp. TaxID=332963 RepID=A0A6J4L7X2_9CYAN|nr:hypothetical protein AVDCRST_MAG94-1609 [uncultured Leptolyngbya sp.]